MRVAFSAGARADIAGIGNHIEHEASPATADRFVQQLLDACESLAHMPRAYPIVTRYRRFGYRRKVFDRYIIIFNVSSDTVEIVRVLHGARDLVSILG